MTNVKQLILLTSILFFVRTLSAQDIDEPWHYSVLNGLPSATIYELFKDSKDQIWFGTENGVICFNGQDFKTYTTKDGLSDNVVIRIMEDSHGRIWFHHQSKMPTYFKSGSIHKIKPPDPHNPPLIEPASYFVENEKNELIIGTKNSLIKIDKMDKVTVMPYRTVNTKIILYYREESGRFIVNHEGPLTGECAEALGANVNIYKNILFLMKRDAFNYETQRNIRTLRDIIDITAPTEEDAELCRILGVKEALSIKKIRDRIFVCREDGLHVFRLRNGNWEEKKYLDGIIVGSVTEDNNDGIWVGTITQGLYCFTNFFLDLETIPLGPPISFMSKISNEIWIGTSNGQIFTLEGDEPIKHFDSDNLVNAQSRINDIKKLKETYFVATGNTIYTFDENHLKEQIGPILYFRKIWVTEDKIIAHSSGGIHMVKAGEDGKYVTENKQLGSEISRVQALAFDGDTMILGSQSGLMAFHKGKKVTWRNGILNESTINFIEKRSNGSFLIGTNDQGMFVFGKKRHKVFGIAEGLISDNVRSITKGKNGRTLLVLEGGIQEISIQNDRLITYGVFDLRSHFKGLDIRNVVVDGDFIYINALEDLVKVPYNSIKEKKRLVLNLTSLRISQKLAEYKDRFEIDYEDNQMELVLSANNYSTFKTKYFYRLNKGAWVDNLSGVIDLQALKEGEYVLEMKAESRMYEESDVHILRFTIVPPWYRTSLFYILSTAIVIGLISWGLRMRYQRIESRKRELMMMELGALQAQMNPHFTFNTLNSIQNYILKNDIRSSINYLSEFSMLMRKILDYAQIQLITIDEEVSFLNSYISLEKQRLKGAFQENMVIDPTLPRNAGIPSMLLQPFVENAIWHGLAHMKEGGALDIHFERIENRMIVTISDNGKGRKFAKKRMEKDSKHKSKGMSITQNRIHIIERLYKAKIEFSIFDLDERKETGTIVRIDLPLLFTNQ